MPDDGKLSGLYERDFYAWSGHQARAIRTAQAALTDSGVNDLRATLTELDWENVAEEIEALGRSDRRELLNRISTVIEHLVKLKCCVSAEPRPGWRETVRRSRMDIEAVLEDSPSLRRQVPDLIHKVDRTAVSLAVRALNDRGDAAGTALACLVPTMFTQDQILEDWWPDSPP